MANEASVARGGAASSAEPARCANCDIEIDGKPVERAGRAFCCEGCAIGGPCVC